MSNITMVGFPDDYINPQRKDKDYWLQVARAIWSRYQGNVGFVHQDTAQYVRKMRAYSSGRQSIEPYLDIIVGRKTTSTQDGVRKYERKGYANVSYEIVSPAPKIKELMLGLLEEIDHTVEAIAVDEVSMDKKLSKKYEMLVTSKLMPVLKKMERINGIPAPQLQVEINNRADLELFEMIGGLKMGMEIALEKLADTIDQESDWKELARLLRADLWDTNRACVRTVYNPFTSKIEKRYVDVEKLVIGRSDSLRPEDIPYAGHVESMTLGKIYSRICSGMSHKEAQAAAEKLISIALSYSGNRYYEGKEVNWFFGINPQDQTPRFYDLTVDVLFFEYITVDRTYKTFREKEDGTVVYHPDTFGEDKTGERRTTNIVDCEMLYDGIWVIGSEFLIEYGPSPFMQRPKKQKVRTNYTYVEIPGASKVERIIGVLDSYQLSRMKLEAAKAAAAPKGISIDINSLANINLGDGIAKPLELIKVYRHTGTLPYRSYSLHNRLVNQNHGSITELVGGIGPQLDEWIKDMAHCLAQIMELTGMNEVSAASPDQSPEQTLGAAQIAMQQTNNSMKMLYEKVTQAKEDSAKVGCSKGVMAIKFNPESKEAYKSILGVNSVLQLEALADTSLERIGMTMVAKPNQHQRNNLLAAASKALEVGKNGKPSLTYADFFTVERMLDRGKVKEAQAFLAYRVQQNDIKNSEEANQSMMALKQEESRINQEKVQGKIMEIEAQKNADLEILDREEQKETTVAKVKGEEDRLSLAEEAKLQSMYNVEIRKKL